MKTVRLAAAVLGTLILSACGASRSAPAAFSRTVSLPYARCTFTITQGGDEATVTACIARISEVFRELDMYGDESDLASVNRAAGRGPARVSADAVAAVGQALGLAAATGGRYDPTVGTLSRLWGISGGHPRIPAQEEIDAVRALVDWRKVAVDEAARAVGLAVKGMALDLGSVLKGYAAVETGNLLASRGVTSAVVDIGGSVVTVGSGSGGRAWRVGVQEPGAPAGTNVGVIDVRDEVVNTSGLYQQFFVSGGKRYAHIFDTATGYPVDNGVEGVTVIRDRHLNADGPSLAILVSGPDGGLALARSLGVEAVIIGADRTIRMTDGIRRRFTLQDTSYRIVR